MKKLEIGLNIGNWGVYTEDQHLNKFLTNYTKFSKAFDGPRTNKRRTIRHINMQGMVACESYGKNEAPECLQQFSDQCGKALCSGEKAHLEAVMWWMDDEEGLEGEGEDGQGGGMGGLVRCVRHGEIARSLKLLASFLYTSRV